MTYQINNRYLGLLLILVPMCAMANDGYQKILKRYMTNTSSLEAKYVQTIYDKNHKKVSNSHGTMMYKKPNLFRIQDDVSHQLMVNDGAYFWQYEPDLEQVIKYNTPKKTYNNHLLYALLNDMSKIYTVFDVESSSSDNKNIKYKLTDKTDPTRSMWVRLVQGELATVEFYDSTGYFNILSFSQLRHNQDISSKWFSFRPNPDVDVIEQ